MQTTYNRQLTYKDYTINLKLELNTKSEKHPNGRTWHTLTVTDIKDEIYHRSYEILNTDYYKDGEYSAIVDFKKFIDNKCNPNKIHLELTELGYE